MRFAILAQLGTKTQTVPTAQATIIWPLPRTTASPAHPWEPTALSALRQLSAHNALLGTMGQLAQAAPSVTKDSTATYAQQASTLPTHYVFHVQTSVLIVIHVISMEVNVQIAKQATLIQLVVHAHLVII